jgi:hypothetical protein
MSFSIGITARNDNYRGDQAQRFIYSINAMLASADEVVYVDWGSPSEIDLVTQYKDRINKTGKLKVVKVTQEQIRRFTNNDPNIPAISILAYNVAIRRCTGDWILSTSLDAIIPKRDLLEPYFQDPASVTIFSRRDFDIKLLQNYDPICPEVLQSWFAEHYKEFPAHGYSGACTGDVWSLIDCCGDFQLLHKDVWYTIRGFEEKFRYRFFVDSNLNKKAILAGYKVAANFDLPTMHIAHLLGGGGSGAVNDLGACLVHAGSTTNSETWGFSNEHFEEFII